MRRHYIEVIQENANAFPRKTAICDSRFRLDYATLDRFSARAAHHLIGLGCTPGDRVVMLTARRAVSVAAILATFKSDCIHVPLDPRMPAARLKYILDDIQPAVVLTEPEFVGDLAAHLPAACRVLLTTELEGLLEEARAAPPPSASLPAHSLDRTAYCIYTSGSTGRPKGVLIRHRSIADFFDGTWRVYDVDSSSVCASFSPLHFDVFLMDMLFPLARGAALHVHDDVIVPDILLDTIRSNGVTHFSAWGMMLGLVAQATDFDEVPLPSVRTILTGTDVPDVKTVQRWLAKNAEVKVINAYGPTEATCAATAYVIDAREPSRSQLYPIGKPLQHVSALLVDEHGARVDAPHTLGELLIGGSQVMTGYWNLPRETEARLVSIDGVRFYRTGDVCSYCLDGNLQFIGRRDHEVKIGGFRIHLSEIQRVIGSVPHVHSSEVVLLESRHEQKLLVAAVLLEQGRGVRAAQFVDRIKRRLAEELPSYMVPRHVVVLDQFPLLSSGKADRGALQLLVQQQLSGANREVLAQ